jgi:AraC-like DNA-binding protein
MATELRRRVSNPWLGSVLAAFQTDFGNAVPAASTAVFCSRHGIPLPRSSAEERVLTGITDILNDLFTRQSANDGQATDFPLLERALLAIDGLAGSPGTHLAEVARLCETSPSTLSHLLKRSTGRSFPDLLQLARLRRACRLLVEGNRSVKEVAAQVGLSSPQLCRAFKRACGASPREWRRSFELRLH